MAGFSSKSVGVNLVDCTNRNLVEINYPDLVVGEPMTERFLSFYVYSAQEKKNLINFGFISG